MAERTGARRRLEKEAAAGNEAPITVDNGGQEDLEALGEIEGDSFFGTLDVSAVDNEHQAWKLFQEGKKLFDNGALDAAERKLVKAVEVRTRSQRGPMSAELASVYVLLSEIAKAKGNSVASKSKLTPFHVFIYSLNFCVVLLRLLSFLSVPVSIPFLCTRPHPKIFCTHRVATQRIASQRNG